MLKIFEFIMNPTFSDSFVSSLNWMGEGSIVLLVILKMGIILGGSTLLCLPFVLLLSNFLFKGLTVNK